MCIRRFKSTTLQSLYYQKCENLCNMRNEWSRVAVNRHPSCDLQVQLRELCIQLPHYSDNLHRSQRLPRTLSLYSQTRAVCPHQRYVPQAGYDRHAATTGGPAVTNEFRWRRSRFLPPSVSLPLCYVSCQHLRPGYVPINSVYTITSSIWKKMNTREWKFSSKGADSDCNS